jgi:2-isopropylmalate synthase
LEEPQQSRQDAISMTSPAPKSKAIPSRDRVLIFDTTMRDGEQSPGASMTIREKVELAELLEDMKVDICEAGFAASSEGDFQCVSQIAERAGDMVICSLARSTLTDIDRAGEADAVVPTPAVF